MSGHEGRPASPEPELRPGPVDLRLAGLAMATWLSALAGLHLSARIGVLLAVAAGLAAVATAAVSVLGPAAAARDGVAGALNADGRRMGGGERAGAVGAVGAGRAGAVGAGRGGRGGAVGTGSDGVCGQGTGLGGLADRRRREDGGRAAVLARRGWLVVAVLIGVLCGSAATAARVAVRDAEQVAAPVGRDAQVAAEVVIRDDPRVVAGSAGRPPTYLIPANLVWFAEAGSPSAAVRVSAPVRLLVLGSHPAWRGLLPGQRVGVTGRFGAARGGDLTAAVLSVRSAPVPLGRPSLAQRAAGSLRSGLQRAAEPLPDEPGGLLPGLVVGDTSRLSPAVEEDFLATGMTHLTAVSGSNVAIVIGFVLLLARWGRAGPWLSAGIAVVALAGFVILVRPSPSVVRAGTMGAVALLALAAGRPRAALPALGAAVTALVLIDPELAGDPGFALSVLATGGLLLLAPRWRDALHKRRVPMVAAEALAVPAAAQLACAPVVAGISGTVSLVAVPANLLAVPAVAPATVIGVAAALLSPIWPPAAAFAAWLACWPAWWLVLVARVGAGLPAGNVPWLDGVAGALLLAGLTGALLVAGRRPAVRRIVAVITAAAVLGALPIRLVADGWPPKGWILVACAVGQGDAVVLAAGSGRAIVVDAGPEPAATDRCLRRLGVRDVSLFVVSHFHADHVGGVSGVFRARRVTAAITPQWSEPVGSRQAVLEAAAAGNARITAVAVGWRARVGPVDLTVLGPPYPMRGTRSDPNNNSLIMLAVVDGVRVLLAGDAEREEQQAVLEVRGASGVRADVLKVAHHGSAFQDGAFLDAVAPSVALVQVGADNDYGHPHPAPLSRLGRGGARVLRTDHDGDLAVLRTGAGLAVAVRGIDPSAEHG